VTLSVGVIKEALRFAQERARKNGIGVEKYVDIIVDFQAETAVERSSVEDRFTAMNALKAIIEADPQAEINPRDTVVDIGLRQCRADRAFVRYHAKQLRLEYEGKKAA